ncbi:MAG: hypothetical protein HQL58_11090 [Magnetococcales bacterium]|nr:hypothetical protein [Magnetococcales bacterium]
MNNKRCKIVYQHGQETCNVVNFIHQKIRDCPPLLAWAEPDLTAVDIRSKTGRRRDFTPLVRGIPDWPEDLPLVEARLFWQISALHVVAIDQCGCRWVCIEESSISGVEVTYSEMSVLTLRDHKRFGLDEQTIERLSAIEYRQNGRLVGWRLVASEVL